MTAFVAILTLTMVLCIGLNNGLLKDFYYQKKQEKVVHYYQKLDQLTNNKSENDSKVSAVLISMRDADNISFIQTTSDWSLDEVSANCVSIFVVTNHPQEISNAIAEVSNHGATILEGEGSYEHCERYVVYSVVSSAESEKVIKAVRETDPQAFINAIRTEQVSGRFYQKPAE